MLESAACRVLLVLLLCVGGCAELNKSLTRLNYDEGRSNDFEIQWIPNTDGSRVVSCQLNTSSRTSAPGIPHYYVRKTSNEKEMTVICLNGSGNVECNEGEVPLLRFSKKFMVRPAEIQENYSLMQSQDDFAYLLPSGWVLDAVVNVLPAPREMHLLIELGCVKLPQKITSRNPHGGGRDIADVR